MAIGGANISRGMGRGAAQVYNTSAPVDAYAKLVQQQQLKREKETKEIQDQFGKLTPEGLRKQDVPGFIEESNKWKSLTIEANSIKDPVKKALKTQEAEQAKINAFAYKQESIDEKKKDDAFYSKSMDPKWRDEFEDDGITNYTKGRQLSIRDPNFIRDMSGFVRKVDTSKTIAAINKIKETLYDLTPPRIIQEIGKMGSDEGTFATEVTEVDPLVYAETIEKAFNIDPNLRVGLNKMYPQFKDLPNDEFIKMVAPEIVKNFPAIKHGNKKFIPKRGELTEFQKRTLALKDSGGGGSNPSNYTVEKDTYLYTNPKERNEYDEPVKGTEKKSMKMSKSVGFDTDYFPLIDAQAFDVDKQKRNAKVSGNFIVGKLAYVPVEDGSYDLRAVVVNSDGDRYVVKPSLLPIGIRKSKNYEAAKKALGAPPIKENAKFTPTQEKAIATGLKDNPGYTRAEIIEGLGL